MEERLRVVNRLDDISAPTPVFQGLRKARAIEEIIINKEIEKCKN